PRALPTCSCSLRFWGWWRCWPRPGRPPATPGSAAAPPARSTPTARRPATERARITAARPGGSRCAGSAASVAEVLEVERDLEVGLFQGGDDLLQVVALLPGDAHLVALN